MSTSSSDRPWLNKWRYRPYSFDHSLMYTAWLDLRVIEFSVYGFPTSPDDRRPTFRMNVLHGRFTVDVKAGGR